MVDPGHDTATQGMLQPLWGLFSMTPFEGAKTQLYLAGSPEVEEKNYRSVSPKRRRPAVAARVRKPGGPARFSGGRGSGSEDGR